ncbi:MAG: GH3 auxin-responsive promoter family protein [Flavobacteriia bacterium]|nr:GH3 auxin-responsive promoter family protein [Flavobacteriia bacterium]
MPIIGKLIKKTSEIAYNRNINKGFEYVNQLKTLSWLLNRAKRTSFGKKHLFSLTLKSIDIVENYQKSVPLTNYEEFYTEWLKDSIAGKKHHTWPGKVSYYALSSGTTGSPSKRIPVTRQMIRSFQKTSVKQISTLHSLNLPSSLFSANILLVGGSSNLTEIENHVEGDLSGILKKHTSLVASPFTKPENEIAKVKDWSKKLELMVNKAPSWNVGIVAGVPSWCIMLMEKIIEKYNLNTIHDIWPNFEVYIHGGVFMKPYIPRLEKIIGKKVHLLDTYLASEGYFAYQTAPDREGMKLLLNNGIFYEFVPFNSDFFDEFGNVKDKHNAFSLSQVQEGIDYALVISTNAGLWRYMIGDLIQFINVEQREIKITGRIKQFLSLSGEHLSLDNINTAIIKTAETLNIEIPEFCIYADVENQRHAWYIGTSNQIDENHLIQTIDHTLSELNDDYRSCRKYNLNNPIIQIVPVSKFYGFMEKIGKAGSQNKFPRVLNENQASNWIEFIEK